MIFFDEFHIFFTSWAFVSQLRLSSEELEPLASNAHAYRLYVFNDPASSSHYPLFYSTVISEALYSTTLLAFFLKLFKRNSKKNAQSFDWAFRHREPDDDLLSHGNPHYHWRRGVSLSCSGWEGVGPPRYGRQAKLFVTQTRRSGQPIYRANQLHRMNEPVVLSYTRDFWMRQLGITSLIAL